VVLFGGEGLTEDTPCLVRWYKAQAGGEEAANSLRSEVADALGTQMVGVERYEVTVAAQEGG
jgi:hypothetical protein